MTTLLEKAEATLKTRSPFVLAVMLVVALLTISCGVQEPSAPSDTRQAPQDAPSSSTRVSFIDVGKGDCILVQTGDATVLIDTGYGNTANEVALHLLDQSVSHLDALVLTHYDKDHVGGLRSIGSTFEIDTVYLPNYKGADKNYQSAMKAVTDLGLQTQLVTKKLSLSLGSAQLVLQPSGVTYQPNANGDEGNDNDLSVVAELTCGSDSYLFAGDLEDEGIARYLESAPGTFDVLKMPHHGERSSNSDELVDELRPKIAVITDSTDDPADKKLLKQLKKADVDTYRTSTCGTVVIESDGTGHYSVSTEQA